jgi:hypothetical protein
VATYTVNDLMKRYVVAQHTVLSWIRSGELKAVNVGVSKSRKIPRWRVTSEALDAFEKMRTPQPPQPKRKRRSKPESDVIEFFK